MARFSLALGIHNHQPIGNFDSVFHRAHALAYAPFLDLVKEHPRIRLSVHQSGILWEWQEKNRPEYHQLVRELCGQDQIDLLTGGYYEPILPVIPERDAREQIGRLTDYLSRIFGYTAHGLWLTERVWEPHLPKLLRESGVNFVAVDDTHFLYAGIQPESLYAPYLTEHEGQTVTLLPILKRLRYLIPFAPVGEVIDELKRMAEAHPGGVAVYADDGEKFGLWPDTHEHCYVKKWLEEFFDALGRESDWLDIIPLGEAAARLPQGRVYLPTASYAEMLEWALPTRAQVEFEQFSKELTTLGLADKYGRFVRGSFWRGFLTKYEEANLMHKRMLAISHRLSQLSATRGRLATLERARTHLFAGQCNCAYWHGVFGGLYLPHLRQGIYEQLIAAEVEMDTLESKPQPVVERIDFDADGKAEVVVRTNHFSILIKPDAGGSLREFILPKHRFFASDTLTRREEAYHRLLPQAVVRQPGTRSSSIHDTVYTREPGLEEYLRHDWYLKRCAIDHFLTRDTDFDRFASGQFGEEGDFVLEPYQMLASTEPGDVRLRRSGNIWRPGGAFPVNVEKQFRFTQESPEFNLTYSISSDVPLDARFGVEWNLSLQAGHSHDRYVRVNGASVLDGYLDTPAAHGESDSIALIDEARGIAIGLESSRPGVLWRLPIYTVSLSEEGFERVYQGTTILFLYELSLTPEPIEIQFGIFGGALADFRHVSERKLTAV